MCGERIRTRQCVRMNITTDRIDSSTAILSFVACKKINCASGFLSLSFIISLSFLDNLFGSSEILLQNLMIFSGEWVLEDPSHSLIVRLRRYHVAFLAVLINCWEKCCIFSSHLLIDAESVIYSELLP